MEDILAYIIIAVIAFALGHKISTIFHVLSFKKILDELGVTREQMIRLARNNGLEFQEPKDPERPHLEIIHIKLEQHQGQIYAFRKDNDQFLGQGQDRDSLISALKIRMNNVRLIIDEGGDLLQKSHNQNA